MQRNVVAVMVLVCLALGVFAFNAGADSAYRGGPSLEERVTRLEESADRQRRAIETLRAENAAQQQIQRLLRFRRDASDRLAVFDRRTVRLDARGIYGGPVDNGQIQLGDAPTNCAGRIAKWNAPGRSLGCVRPAP
jgi:hypothetical protein